MSDCLPEKDASDFTAVAGTGATAVAALLLALS